MTVFQFSPTSARRRMRAGLTLAVTGVLAMAAACGGKAPESVAADDEGLSVGIFVDNAFGDGDFFDQAAAAQETLERDLDATVNTYEGQLEAQNFEPLLRDAAMANDIVYVLGFEAIDALIKVAEENPDTEFVFIDGTIDSEEVTSAEFRTAEGCFMAGALAATVNRDAGAKVAGYVGGVDAPVIKNCESGFRQGVAEVAPAQTVRAQYAGSFVDPSKGREIAISLANKGAYAVFSYAGLTGSGVSDAAKSGQAVAPIGVVSDKEPLAPGKTPGSLLMGVDAVIMQLTQDYLDDEFDRGSQHTFGFAEDGWDMTYDEELVGANNVADLKALQEKIAAGELKVSE